MSDLNPPSVPDLLLRIMQQQDTGFAEIRGALADQNKTIHRIDRDVALLQNATEQMKALPARVQMLESARDLHARRLDEAERDCIDHQTRIGGLEGAHNKRSGWENFGGKMLFLMGGGLITAIIGAVALALRQ